MIFGSVCSGIGAPEAAWTPLGWRCAFMSEIEAFPRAVLAHHYPETPLHGDFTTIEAGRYDPIDVLVGGAPCQSFSIAGLRGGLSDDRGNLALEFLRLADRLRPRWVVWENVPGVLSSGDGRDFGAILGGLVELGYGFSYRVLDAQFFGVAQRRRRVFVVGHLGDWRRAAAVLFERQGLSGHPAPRREAGQRVARPIASSAPGGSGYRNDADTADNLIAGTLTGRSGNGSRQAGANNNLAFGGNNTAGEIDIATAVNAHGGPHGRLDFESETLIAVDLQNVSLGGELAGTLDTTRPTRGGGQAVLASTLRTRDLAKGVDSDCTDTLIAHSLRGEGFDASEDGTGRGTPLIPVYAPESAATIVGRSSRGGGQTNSPGHNADQQLIVHAFDARQSDVIQYGDRAGPIDTDAYSQAVVLPIQESGKRTGASSTSPKAGDGLGDDGDPMFTLGADSRHAIAFALRGREGGALPEAHEQVSALRSASGGASRDFIAFDPTQITSKTNRSQPKAGAPAYMLSRSMDPPAVAFNITPSQSNKDFNATAASAVRRLTPRECERLQGFPDDFTAITYRGKPAADGPRYKAIGNSMAVPVMAWIGRRIAMVDAMPRESEAA